MEADAHGGHDAKVAAAAAQRPEQVGLRVRTGRHAPPVRQHDLGAEQVVSRQAAGAAEGAVAAPQGQAGHADRAAEAQCRDQAVGAGGGGHILDPGAARDSGHKRSRVHRHIPHPGEVDDEPAVAQGAARPVVPAAAHRQRQAVATRGAHRRLHVLGLFAERDYRGAAAHGTAPYARALVIELVPWHRHAAGYGCSQFVRTV
jgi:hypothetical protein